MYQQGANRFITALLMLAITYCLTISTLPIATLTTLPSAIRVHITCWRITRISSSWILRPACPLPSVQRKKKETAPRTCTSTSISRPRTRRITVRVRVQSACMRGTPLPNTSTTIWTKKARAPWNTTAAASESASAIAQIWWCSQMSIIWPLYTRGCQSISSHKKIGTLGPQWRQGRIRTWTRRSCRAGLWRPSRISRRRIPNSIRWTRLRSHTIRMNNF